MFFRIWSWYPQIIVPFHKGILGFQTNHPNQPLSTSWFMPRNSTPLVEAWLKGTQDRNICSFLRKFSESHSYEPFIYVYIYSICLYTNYRLYIDCEPRLTYLKTLVTGDQKPLVLFGRCTRVSRWAILTWLHVVREIHLTQMYTSENIFVDTFDIHFFQSM